MSERYASEPVFNKWEGVGYHGTSLENAACILEEQTIIPSKIDPAKAYKPWYGEGIYLYEDAIYSGAESAFHYVTVIRKKASCKVVKATYKVDKLLDMTNRRNYEYLLQFIIPLISREYPDLAESMTPQIALSLWKTLDPGIQAVRGASFEGEGIGLSNPKFGNLLLDVQLIICLSSPEHIRYIEPAD